MSVDNYSRFASGFLRVSADLLPLVPTAPEVGA
jgi:hypothetical protein